MNRNKYKLQQIPTDLWLEKLFRIFGIVVAKQIVKTINSSPNQITTARVVYAVVIGFIFFSPNPSFYLLGWLLLFWKVLDKTDGALARMTNQMTPFGHWFDMVLDRFFWGFCFFSFAWITYRLESNVIPWILLSMIFFFHWLFNSFTHFHHQTFPTKLKIKSQLINADSILYQIIFSFYYLYDIVSGLFFLSFEFFQKTLGINMFLILLICYVLFFISASSYAAYIHTISYKKFE